MLTAVSIAARSIPHGRVIVMQSSIHPSNSTEIGLAHPFLVAVFGSPRAKRANVRVGQLVVAGDLNPSRLDRGNGILGEALHERPVPLLTGCRQGELLDVSRRHSAEPVQPLGVERRRSDHAGTSCDSLRKPRCAGQGVRAAPRAAPDRELTPSNPVEDRDDVLHHIGDDAVLPSRRRAVAGAVHDKAAARRPAERPRSAEGRADECPAYRIQKRPADPRGRRTRSRRRVGRRRPCRHR